jgi:hypothetical protein
VDQGEIVKFTASLKKLLPQFSRDLYHTLRPQVILISGREKQSNMVLHIGYVGNMPRAYRLGFPGQIFRELDDEIDLGVHWLWQLRKILKVNGCTFALVESSLYLQRFLCWLFNAPAETCFLPFYVHSFIQVADIPRILANNDGLKHDIKRARDLACTLRVSDQPALYRAFLDDYNRPYLISAHGAMAATFDYEFLTRGDCGSRDQFELQQVMLDGEWVAGCIVRKDGETAYLEEAGVRRGDRDLLRRGAVATSYWLAV